MVKRLVEPVKLYFKRQHNIRCIYILISRHNDKVSERMDVLDSLTEYGAVYPYYHSSNT
jgi:hypothetical protein